MAEQLLQYQPITGPVWTEPVAEKLAWQPRDRYSGKPLARAPLRDYSVYPLQPPAVPGYDPNVLDWQARDSYAGRALARARFDVTVRSLEPIAVAYNPNALDWLARDRYSGRALARGRLDYGEPSQFAFVYDLADWFPSDRYAGRPLPRTVPRDWTVLPPRVVAVAYDPSTLEWQPKGREPRVPLEVRRLGDFAQPPFVAPAYDPRTLEWIPQGRAPRVPVERRVLGDFQQPPFAALYRPERLEWQPCDRYYGRPIPFGRQGYTWAFSIPISEITEPPKGYLVGVMRMITAIDGEPRIVSAMSGEVSVSFALGATVDVDPDA